MKTTIARLPIPAVFLLSLGVIGLPSAHAQNAATPSSPTTQPYSPAILPGNGLAQHPFLYTGEFQTPNPIQSIFIVRGGKIDWQYDIPTNDATNTLEEFSDATMLSNGNVVFARKTGAGEVTPDKKLIWNYQVPAGFEVHVVQPLGLDRVMFVQNGDPATVNIINIKTGQIEKTVTLPTGNPKATHLQFRRVRITRVHTILATHMDANKVSEYDMDGKEIWTVKVASPWAATRLDNGNTLISSNRAFVREVNPKGETVWEFDRKDAPGYRISLFQEADRLSNGNTLMANWCPNDLKDPKNFVTSVQLLEVTPDKKIVWALRSWDPPNYLGPASTFQLLDEPGVPENGDQNR